LPETRVCSWIQRGPVQNLIEQRRVAAGSRRVECVQKAVFVNVWSLIEIPPYKCVPLLPM
jgi:hypothetical protein